MAFIDVIKWDSGHNQIAWKFPSSNLRIGSQLVVKPGQRAFFVYRGKVCDELSEGTITIQTGNIPLLTKLMSLPFGGDTPFQAEVWFINTLVKLDTKWGTPAPIQVEDPKYGIIVPMRAFGQYGFRISNPSIFLTTLLGAQSTLTDDQIKQYFRGKVISTIGTLIGKLFNDSISFLNISSHLDNLSESAKIKITPMMERFGIHLETFFFESISVPEDDPSYLKLKKIKEKSAEINVVGRDIYQFDKSMDVLKASASNEGLAGLLTQSGMGAGMGMMMGAQIGQQAGNMMTSMPPQFPVTPEIQYHVVVNGQQLGPLPITVLQQMVPTGTFTATSMVWHLGLAGWQQASTITSLLPLFSALPTPISPPPIPPI